MNGITPGKNDAVQQHNVSDFEFANIGVGKGSVQADHLSGRQSQVRHRFLLLKFVRGLIQPLEDLASGIQNNATPSISPAHVSHGYKKLGGQPVQLANLPAAN